MVLIKMRCQLASLCGDFSFPRSRRRMYFHLCTLAGHCRRSVDTVRWTYVCFAGRHSGQTRRHQRASREQTGVLWSSRRDARLPCLVEVQMEYFRRKIQVGRLLLQPLASTTRRPPRGKQIHPLSLSLLSTLCSPLPFYLQFAACS